MQIFIGPVTEMLVLCCDIILLSGICCLELLFYGGVAIEKFGHRLNIKTGFLKFIVLELLDKTLPGRGRFRVGATVPFAFHPECPCWTSPTNRSMEFVHFLF